MSLLDRGIQIKTPEQIEAMRRFANIVRAREQDFADLIARETGKPFWEARTEVGAVINKVEISIDAHGERTPSRRLQAAMGNKVAVRHKPHGVLALLGPYNFPAHLPNGHIVPALLAALVISAVTILIGLAVGVLVDEVSRAMDAGVLRRDDPQEAAQVIWSAVHGAVALELAGVAQVDDPDASYERLLVALVAGLG